MSDKIHNDEQIARLLFYPQMIENETLSPSVFPMDELLAKRGKNGSSVDRCCLLDDRDKRLYQKAHLNANQSAGREPYGFCTGKAEDIRAVREQQNCNQAFEILPDKITGNIPAEPWGCAHALLRKFDDSYSRANLRGARDKLSDLFAKDIVKF